MRGISEREKEKRRTARESEKKEEITKAGKAGKKSYTKKNKIMTNVRCSTAWERGCPFSSPPRWSDPSTSTGTPPPSRSR